MDIKLKRVVKPHITADTSFDQLVEIAETRDAIAHSTGLYGTRSQHSNAVSNAVISSKSKDTTNALPITPPSTIRYHPKKKKDAKEKELVTIVES